MIKLLCPCFMVNSLFAIDCDLLRDCGIRGVIFDLDNTIIPWDSEIMEIKIETWLKGLHASGFQLCIVSNNRNTRVRKIARQIGVPFVSRAFKPFKSGFRQAAAAMALSEKEVAVVGDQIFTDVLGGNRLGMVTFLVPPLNKKEFVGTYITRMMERIAIKWMKSRGLI